MEASKTKTNIFAGLSSLRAQERVDKPLTEEAKALQNYLKKYSNAAQGEEKDKRKKRKKRPVESRQGVKIIDEDTTGFKVTPTKKAKVDLDAEVDDEDAPVVANPGEAELFTRLLKEEQSGLALKSWTAVGDETRGSGDLSPIRRERNDSPDASPPRRQRRDSPDPSPPRRQMHDSPDSSPPRRQHIGTAEARTHDRPKPYSSPLRPKPGSKPLADGVSAGMVSGDALTAQLERKRVAERERFAKLEAENGSRHAETVYRDKETGQRMSKQEFEAAQKEAVQKKKATYEVPEWGVGVKQMRDWTEEAAAMQREAARPFARSLDTVDEDLNLRDRIRFGDPMAHLAKKHAAAPPPPVIPEHMAKQMKKSGFVVPQEVLSHSWLKRKMGPPPNRYGIKPGRHWDGVDRSTGFEREMFKQQAARKALEREARMWAQSDM